MENFDFKKDLHFNEFPAIDLASWEKVIQSDLKGKNYKEVLKWDSGEGISALPFYRREHLKNLVHEPSPIHKNNSWNIIESIGDQNISEANKVALKALESGASGLIFDLNSNRVTSKADLEKLLKGIQFEFIMLKFGVGLSTPEVAEWLSQICAEEQKPEDKLHIYFSFNPFTSALATGSLPGINEIKKLYSQIDKSFKFASVDSSSMANSGANIVQQVALSLAAGNELLGIDKHLADRMYFNFAVGNSYFPEIAKFRAIRLLWNQILHEYKLKQAPTFVHAETCLWNKARNDAHNNMLRSTTEAMSAALGGCSSITIYPYDVHFKEPSIFSKRIARNIHLILKEEAYLNKVADPGAGSYYIETLTDKIAQESWNLFRELEANGGFYECLKSGLIQSKIKKARQKKIDAYFEKERVLVGVNKYPPDEKADPEELRISKVTNSGLSWNNITDIETIGLLNMEKELEKGASK